MIFPLHIESKRFWIVEIIDSWIVDFFSITYTILSFLLQFYKIAELQLCESLINSFKVPKSKKQHQNR